MKPIVYWIDSATPTKWIPYMKRGVEKWQKAFEAAGFNNAIIAKLAPTPQQGPDFSPEDARYSVIRWLPSTIENASGPHIHDPRTGEILESDIQFYHNIMNLQRAWYFLQAGPRDPRAQKFPLPDDLMGTLLEFVVAHEVGHTLGFQQQHEGQLHVPARESFVCSDKSSRRLMPAFSRREATVDLRMRTTLARARLQGLAVRVKKRHQRLVAREHIKSCSPSLRCPDVFGSTCQRIQL